MSKIEREKQIITLMIKAYCKRRHNRSIRLEMCDDCRALLDYASRRLDHCPKGDGKSSCRKCSIHCYSPENAEKIRLVMREIGPRMIYLHPLAAIRHLITEIR